MVRFTVRSAGGFVVDTSEAGLRSSDVKSISGGRASSSSMALSTGTASFGGVVTCSSSSS